MEIIVKVSSLFLFAWLCAKPNVLGATEPGGGLYDYYGISDPSSFAGRIRFDARDKTIVYPATYVKYSDCSSSEFFCIESPRLSFCIPKGDVWPGSWKCGEEKISYRNEGLLQLRIFGRIVPVTVIATEGVDYYYSKDFGVVMFRVKGVDQLEETYWSADLVGFGALVKNE